MKTGRDVVVAALLGAEEFGFATAPLVVSGCVMMRVCHLDTCPVGIATQNPELRERFTGKPEFVETFFEYIAEEVREILAALGLRSLEEAVGRADLLDAADAVDHWKAAGLDLAPILHAPTPPGRRAPLRSATRTTDSTRRSTTRSSSCAGRPSRTATPVRGSTWPCATWTARWARCSGYEITRRYGGAGPARRHHRPDASRARPARASGRSCPRGVTMRLFGDANDYLGKGLSGGRIVVRPPADAPFVAEDNIIAGNVILYGATAGEVFLRGQVGERFCVRNSGAIAVVEGVGDHGCEYMTGGRVVVLGPTGRNFAAGMSGGIAYVYDPERRPGRRLNREMVDLEPLTTRTGRSCSEGSCAHLDADRLAARRAHSRRMSAALETS